MNAAIDVDHVLADLRELHELHRRPRRRAAARVVAGLAGRARRGCAGKLAELPVTVDRDEAGQPLGRAARRRRDAGFVIVGSHIDAVPSGGWLDGALGVLAALGVLRALAAAGRRRRR